MIYPRVYEEIDDASFDILGAGPIHDYKEHMKKIIT